MKHDHGKRLLVQALYKKGWTPTDIASHLKVERPFVYRWKDREDSGRLPGSGRKPKLDKKTLASIERKLKKSGASQRKIAAQVGVHQTTVGRAAKQLGLKVYHPRKRPILSSKNKQKRLDFAIEHSEDDWSDVLFEDEKTFEVGSHPNRKNDVVYAYSIDEVPEVPTAAHPAKVHVAAGVSVSGRTKLDIFTENMDGPLFKDILKRTLIPGAEEIFGDKQWHLAMDNDPKHRSKVVTEFLDSQGISYWPKSEWPAQGPDLNPMENVWAMLLAEVNQKPPSSVSQLKRRLNAAWSKLDQEKLSNTVHSMNDRLRAVKAAKGGSTKY